MANLIKTELPPKPKAEIYIYIWNSPRQLKYLKDFKSIVRWRMDQRVNQGQIVYVYETKTDRYYLWRQFANPVFIGYKDFTDTYKNYTIEYNH